MPVMRLRDGRLLCGLAIAAALALTVGWGDAALAQGSPFGVGRPATPPAPPPDGLVGWIMAKQAEFYLGLRATIRAAKTDGTAVWALFGLSLAYGVFHAAGPGHGKAVISSYLVANQETWRRGIILSFASAMLQAAVAVAIVAVAAGVLNVTAQVMNRAVYWIEVVSFSLIAAIGLWLTLVKGRAFLAALQERFAPRPALAAAASVVAPAHDHHHHGDHGHDHGHAFHADGHAHGHDEHCGHSHGPEPRDLAGPGGWKRGLAAIVAVGLRPCSGAILVLVFTLAQGIFWVGIASTFIMGLGTAISVAVIATLTVTATDVAVKFARARSGLGALAVLGAEVLAAIVVFAFGALLLMGYMASERMLAA
jgi:ABC-type nickel/cobalt efflux system permease component RcnA